MDDKITPGWNSVTANINRARGGTYQFAQVINNYTIAAPVRGTQLPEVWGTPPLENPRFFKRKLTQHLDEKMAASVSKTKNTGVRLFVLSGLGGVGKTELAKNYFYSEKDYTAKLWFNAANREHLEAEYRYLAQELHLIEDNADIALVTRTIHAFLAQHPGWLMILDNADDANAIQSLLPKHGGDVLITSRQPTWRGEIIEVGLLAPEEASNFYYFYQKHDGQRDDEDAVKELVATLGYLLLAIAQAAAYILAEPISAAKYLEDFKHYKKHILETNSLLPVSDKAEQDRLTIMTTWHLSLAAIEKQNPGTESMPFCATELLKACAYLASHNIPRSLLEKWLEACYPNKEAKFILRNAIRQLHNHSLIQCDEQFVQVHSLVQEVMRYFCKDDLSTLRKILLALISLFNMNFDNKTFNWLSPHLVAVTHYSEQTFTESCDLIIIGNIYKMWADLMKHMTFEHFETIEKYNKALQIIKKCYKGTDTVTPDVKMEELYIRYNIALLNKIISLNYSDILVEFKNIYDEYMLIKEHVRSKKQYDFFDHKVKREIGSTKYYMWYYLGSHDVDSIVYDMQNALDGFKNEGGIECPEQIRSLYDLGGVAKQLGQCKDESKVIKARELYVLGFAMANKCYSDNALSKERFHIPNFLYSISTL